MATYRLTFITTTKLWDTVAGSGIIDYPSTEDAAPGGPYAVSPVIIPFDPIHQTGGSFWFLTAGPYIGKLVSQHTNDLGYGSILVETTDGTPAPISKTHINPMAPWRLLIKGMGGSTNTATKTQLTFNTPTDLWSRTTTGIINYDYSIANLNNAGTGGPYDVVPIVVPFDPIHETGGSFYVLKEGPYTGYLVSFWSDELGYGDITVTQVAGFDRGPGAVLATFGPGDVVPTLPTGTGDKKAHLVGANILYNAAGEMHFTLLNDHPSVRVPYPKQTHYAIEFWNVDTQAWDEVFAGLIWDFDATDTEVVFYGIDYLALYQYTIDERFDLNFAERAAPVGSKYVDRTITDIVTAHLQYSQSRPDSLVGFIAIGSIAPMLEKVTIFSTFQDSLSFIGGLIESHRAGTGKQTRMKVIKIAGVYTFTIEDDPGVVRDHLPLEYGTLVQGYRIIPFGESWASRVNFIARNPKGERLKIVSDSSAVDQGVWGRIGQPPSIVEVVDTNDLKRRALQAAIDASRLGRQIGVGLKLGSFRPLEGYDITDEVPVVINHGAVVTQDWGSDDLGLDDPGDPSGTMASYWSILGIEWESYDDSHWMTNLILWPRGRRPRFGSCEGFQSFQVPTPNGNKSTFAWEISGAEVVPIDSLSVTQQANSGTFNPGGLTVIGNETEVLLLFGYCMGNDTDSDGPGGFNSGGNFTSTDLVIDHDAKHGVAPGNYLLPENVTGHRMLTAPTAGDYTGTILYGGFSKWGANAIALKAKPGQAIQIVQSKYAEGLDGVDQMTVTLDSPTAGGNLVVAWCAVRSGPLGSEIGLPTGWTGLTQVDTHASTNAGNGGRLMYVEVPCLNGDPIPQGVPVPATSDPIIPRTPIGVGHGPPPTGSNPSNTQTYVDLDTGQVWTWNDDTGTWSTTGGPSLWNESSVWMGMPGLDGEEGPPGPMGPPGLDADPGAVMVPYYIASSERFLVPIYKQALFEMLIENDGILDIEGFLVMVN